MSTVHWVISPVGSELFLLLANGEDVELYAWHMKKNVTTWRWWWMMKQPLGLSLCLSLSFSLLFEVPLPDPAVKNATPQCIQAIKSPWKLYTSMQRGAKRLICTTPFSSHIIQSVLHLLCNNAEKIAGSDCAWGYSVCKGSGIIENTSGAIFTKHLQTKSNSWLRIKCILQSVQWNKSVKSLWPNHKLSAILHFCFWGKVFICTHMFSYPSFFGGYPNYQPWLFIHFPLA